jgi:hypothetical protein
MAPSGPLCPVAQTSSLQIKTWNNQIKANGNPFRLRLTIQSPFI